MNQEEFEALCKYAETLPRDDFGAIDTTLIDLQVWAAYTDFALD